MENVCVVCGCIYLTLVHYVGVDELLGVMSSNLLSSLGRMKFSKSSNG